MNNFILLNQLQDQDYTDHQITLHYHVGTYFCFYLLRELSAAAFYKFIIHHYGIDSIALHIFHEACTSI